MDAKQFILMQERLDNHIKEYKQHCEDDAKRWGEFIEIQKSNTESIKELVSSNKDLCDSTRDIVDVWKAADGTMKTMSAVGRFVKWLSGFAVVGIAIKWAADWLN